MSDHTPAAMIKTWLTNPQTRARIESALMGSLPADAFAEQCIMVSRDRALSRCSPDSLLAAFLKCAQIGLMPGAQQLVHLIARGQSVDVMITARGYKTLMERLPQVLRIKAVLVHKLDEWNGVDDDGAPLHKADPLTPGRTFDNPEDLLGGYLAATFVDGSQDWHFVSAAEVDACRRCAKSQAVWKKWFGQMALKTIYRQAWARMFLPAAPHALGEAIQAAEAADRIGHQEHPSYDADAAPLPLMSAPAVARALTYDPPAQDGPPQAADLDPGEVGTE